MSGVRDDGFDGRFDDRFEDDEESAVDEEFDADILEEELRQAVAVLDPVPDELRQIAIEAFALHDMDAKLAELTFDSLVDAIPVRGAVDVPRMLTFTAGDLTVDVEVTPHGLLGQILPPQPAGIEVLGGPHPAAPTTLTADGMGRFAGDAGVSGPFALRLRTGGDVIVTEWLRA
ncbi:hypothetical protein [Streptomyces mangrovisoli]|uniref:Carboxypeptidase regulatory-like domain-containing protein n=1 Tax=Streptomyces mangrovisoli TaxID=1428628 RepID=A0A1J4NMB7_9ACTN|nr:hypothetical protein [Streptomyces mangrovisoli]OIJ63290.1 hypothetical protein WN71_035040 [Streptomyces mangrovisoli]